MALTQIDTGGIKDDAVTDAKLPANSVGNSEMKDDAVGIAELSATGTASSSTFLRGDNSWVTPTDTNTQLSTEEVQDIVGGMFTGNTETNITATYQDADGTIDLVSTDTNTQLSTEEVQDIVGAMFTGNTETNITATYEDSDGTIDLVVGATGAALTGSTNNTITTVTGANAIQGEANLTFDGDHITQTIDASGEGINQTAAGNHYIENLASANRSSADGVIWRQTADWNGKTVAQIKLTAGSDTTNKDDGYITFWTSAANDNNERLRIDSSGRVLIGTTTEGYSSADDLTIETAGHTGITIRSGTSSEGALMFSDGTSGADEYRGFIQYKHSNNNIDVGVNSVEKIRIHTDGTTSFATGIGLGNALNYAAANTLEDYEEGSFTPNGGSGNSVGLTMESGCRYTKVGNQVHIECDFHIATNSVSAVLKLGNLPFTPVNYSGGVVNWTHYNETLVAHCGGGGIWLNKGANTDGSFYWSDMSNKRVIFALTYTTTS